jgi:2,4-dichlorophenol 6-monooxygenase
MPSPGSDVVEVPVLIVGAGPAGLALSVALSRYGVGHLVIERHRGTAHSAQQLPAVIEQALGLTGRQA